MAKSKKQKKVRVKRERDLVPQRVRKAKRCLKSSGIKGLTTFLEHYPELKRNKFVQGLVEVGQQRAREKNQRRLDRLARIGERQVELAL